MITVKNAEITSENTEKDTLGCKNRNKATKVHNCVFITTYMHTYNKKFFCYN